MNAAEIADRLRRQEDQNCDFKAAANFSGAFRAGLTVDIAAMSNTPGGGLLVIGVRKVAGVWTVEGCDAAQLTSFDMTTVMQFIRNVLDPAPRFEIEQVAVEGKELAIFAVSEFEDVPIVVTKTIQEGDRLFAKEGDLFVRSEAAETRRVQSAGELRKMLGRAISRKSENLLADIRAVVTGAGPRKLEKSPPELFEEELPSWLAEAAAFDTEYGAFARWEVKVLPVPLSEPLDPRLAHATLRGVKVSLRGWDFPALPVNQDPIFGLNHLEVRMAWQEFREIVLYSYRGAFGFTSVIWTELKSKSRGFSLVEPPARILDAIGILWSYTEFFRFALNLAEAMHSDAVWLQVTLKGVRGRELGSFDPRRMWWGEHKASTNEIPLDGLFSTASLKSSWKEDARAWTKKAFTVFQWPGPNEEQLAKDQDELVERRLRP